MKITVTGNGACVAIIDAQTKEERAKLKYSDMNMTYAPASLLVMCPSIVEDGVYQPAESVTLYGRDILLKLRDALNLLLDDPQEVKDANG